MSTKDTMGIRRIPRQGGLWRTRWPVTLVLLAAVVAGCRGGEAPSRKGPPGPASPTHGSDQPIAQHKLDKLAGFLDKVEFRGRVGPEFELRRVQYTSPTDAVAEFVDYRPGSDEWGMVIATTDDNWAHASRLYISHDLADLVDYVPLGRGAVAIRAKDQSPRKWYPPFVLYPNGKVKPLQVGEPRALDVDSELLKISLYDLFSPIGAGESDGVWAADVDSGEVFPVEGSPIGDVWQQAPGRDDQILSVAGYRRKVGDGVWRFETSTDSGHSWLQTDVVLPLGPKPIWRYADAAMHAVGPGQLQAIAMADYPEDMPMYLFELWRTEDEKEFRRVRLPWERVLFGGMAFASDGALLFAQVTGPATYCDRLVCNRAGKIWRLAPGGTDMKLLRDAPRLFGPFWAVGIDFSGGMIVARTGLRTIALSEDGYTWTDAVPG